MDLEHFRKSKRNTFCTSRFFAENPLTDEWTEGDGSQSWWIQQKKSKKNYLDRSVERESVQNTLCNFLWEKTITEAYFLDVFTANDIFTQLFTFRHGHAASTVVDWRLHHGVVWWCTVHCGLLEFVVVVAVVVVVVVVVVVLGDGCHFIIQ